MGFSIFVTLLAVGIGVTAAGWLMTCRLVPAGHRRQTLLWLGGWSFKGVLVPCALWALLNLGVSYDLQAFMPQVQLAQVAGVNWMPAFLRVAGFGIFVVTSYWAAVTLAWALVNTHQGLRGERRSNFHGLCLTCGLALLLVAVGIVLLGGWPLAGLAALAILTPIAAYAPGFLEERKLPPMYARAVAKMKFGKYTEAEWEIIRQLESQEDDFQGWMMLAELYANHFNDLGEAESTILEICDQPRVTPSQISVALHKLADWHLKMAADPNAARRALEVICSRLPGSHLARMARLRIQQIPATVEDVREAQVASAIPLPALGDSLEEDAPADPADREQAAQAAISYANRLRQNPNNTQARERLARLLAEHLGEPAQGLEQIQLLLDMPEQPEQKRADWLSLAAAWNLKYLQDVQTARSLLEHLVATYPESPQAFAARHRLEKLS